jgi:superfamily II DNA or RNA helicase
MNLQIFDILNDVATRLRDFLARSLASIRSDWWNALVVANLTEQQQRILKSRRSTTLDGLDLAALLRVFNYNFDDISQRDNPPRDLRTWLKEMQGIRNKYAHPSGETLSVDDQWRDLDTIQRFSAAIGAQKELLDTIGNLKTSLIQSAPPPAAPAAAPPTVAAPSTEFAPGDEVALKSDPGKVGYVVQIITSKPENRYTLIIDGKKLTCYASQLERRAQPAATLNPLALDAFKAHLAALQLRFPGISNLYSLNSARIDFIPYQFRPVLKFIHADRPRLLVADSVGVGKTIEAGLILRELQARREIRSVLIICPKPLITERKWQLEMRRFDENFIHLDGEGVRNAIDQMDMEGVWPDQFARVILPYSLIDESLMYGTWRGDRQANKGLLDLDPPPHFDLVIVDEAHRIRNPETLTHKGVRFFCDHAEAVVFLTATPVQLASDDLFVLLNTLRPDLVLDRATFSRMAEPNPHINQAVAHIRSNGSNWQDNAFECLQRAANTPWGTAILTPSPDFQKVIADLRADTVSPERRVAMIREVEEFHSFSRLLNRTRRRDIGEFTIRRPETIHTPFTLEQKLLHDLILLTQAQILIALHGDVNVAFLMTTIRRQAASCVFGLVPLLSGILTRHLEDLRGEEDEGVEISTGILGSLDAQIRNILEMAKRLPPADPKLDALMTVLREKQTQPANKVIVFSTFRHTLAYLLAKLSGAGLRVACIHGDTREEERRSLRDRFKRPKDDPNALDVLLFSEVGSEGLDYQFCDCMVNYDLPWNPMKIEQRIGRIDRKGQKSPSVSIYNLITPGTVDADIYERCLLRIGVFNQSIGGSEEILGDIATQINQVADNSRLSPDEQRQKLAVIADNQIRLLQAQQELEENQLELFGITIPENQPDDAVKAATSYWLSPQVLELLVRLYLGREGEPDKPLLLGEKEAKTLRASAEARARLLRDFQTLPKQPSLMVRQWENWLKGANPHLPVTFDPAFAQDSPDHALLSPVHPLIRQAAAQLVQTDRAFTALAVSGTGLTLGRFPFAIYCWHHKGIRETLVFQAISVSDQVQERFAEIVAKAVAIPISPEVASRTPTADLDAKHHTMWQKARDDHRTHAARVAAFQRESLKTSQAARMALLREQLAQAQEDRIRRMRQSQIDTAELDYQRHLQDIDLAIARADIISEEVASGIILIQD